MDFYVKAESEDGYIRDACVYRRNINIWDTMTLNVRYHTGVIMSYSLNCFMPYEGYRDLLQRDQGETRGTCVPRATVGSGPHGRYPSDTVVQGIENSNRA